MLPLAVFAGWFRVKWVASTIDRIVSFAGIVVPSELLTDCPGVSPAVVAPPSKVTVLLAAVTLLAPGATGEEAEEIKVNGLLFTLATDPLDMVNCVRLLIALM